MDTMDNTATIFDNEEVTPKAEVTPIKEEDSAKGRRPYVSWDVKGQEYKLKLTTSVIKKLEQTFKTSLLNAVLEEGIPPVSTTTTLLQAAMQKFHHGIKSYTVEGIVDDYLDEGGTQVTLLMDVIYPLMYDAGFFTEAMLTAVTTEIKEMDTQL